jgi:hypothetical protein
MEETLHDNAAQWRRTEPESRNGADAATSRAAGIVEKRYEELKAGDRVWWFGALVEIEKVHASRGVIRDFEGRFVAPDGTGLAITFSGLAYSTVRTEAK